MRLLVDTNILIPAEPTAAASAEPTTPRASELLSLASGHHAVLVHPASRDELLRDPNPDRRALRALQLQKYRILDHPPAITPQLEQVLGAVQWGSNDFVDHQLLAAVAGDAVHLLVTEDAVMHRKAQRLGFSDRVLTLADAVETLRAFLGRIPSPPPLVEPVPAHALNVSDPIFDSFREDYVEFDQWIASARQEGRQAWVIRATDGTYAAVCIVKDRDDEYGLGGRVLKVSSFKVSQAYQGNRYGELLLKTVFTYCAQNHHDAMWVTVFEQHANLIALMSDFGFAEIARSERNEIVLAKQLTPDTDSNTLEALAFHVRFGPPALRVVAGDTYIVPIQPRFHALLFPDADADHRLFVQPDAFGNAIRKAYLSHASIRKLRGGETLLFYRSKDVQSVTIAGVVESTLVSKEADDVVRFVAGRSVYPQSEIEKMCSKPVLAIRFRQDRVLARPIGLSELTNRDVVARAPQTISAVHEEGIEWLTQRLGA